jgi:opacity protein-like surface antigen
MKTVKISALALAMMGVFAASANAQSVKVNAWEGAYGQVGVGYGMFVPKIGSGTATTPNTAVTPAGTPGVGGGVPLTSLGYPSSINQSASASSTNNVNTATASLSAGYNFGINETWILGLGASYYPGASSGATGQLSIANTTINGLLGPQTANGGTTTATYNVKNLYSITVTPGYAIDKERLAYAKLGYTGATIGLSGPTLAYQSTNLTGWTLGLGYKQMFTEHLYAFGEVNYGSYGNKNLTATLTNGTVLNGMTVSGNGTDILVGVGYRF